MITEVHSRHHFTTWPKAISIIGAWSDKMSAVKWVSVVSKMCLWGWQIGTSNAGNRALLGNTWGWSTIRSSKKSLQANCQTIESHFSSPWRRLLSLYPGGTDCNSDLHKYSRDPFIFLEGAREDVMNNGDVC